VGVKRQWCGRLGKTDNCQVGIYMGYASRKDHALADERLYLPKDWAEDPARRENCGVPEEVKFRTRHELAVEMLKEKGEMLPHAWIAGDTEMGRSTRFRASLRRLRERYLLAVPCDTTIRDLEGEIPPGRRKRPFERVDKWTASLSNEAWTRVDVRDGEKGPIVVEAAKTRVRAKTDKQRIGPEELLFVTRTVEGDGKVDHDYYLSDAPPQTPLEELARVAKAEKRVEESIKRAKSEAGLSDYQVRSWTGWHHHQTLSLMASWFLTLEGRRGKKGDARDDGAAGGQGLGDAAA
jgi:SRSO17 transposase